MTLSFPLVPSDFSRLLVKQSVRFWLQPNLQYSGLASGQMIVADLGPKYWMAEIGLSNMGNNDAMAIQALINAMDGGLNPVLMYDPRCEYPQYDPTGSIMGASTVTNSAVRSNGKEMQFSGLPAGYKISPGDMFTYLYGSGNVYRALHQVVVGDTANGSGNTGWIEFRPHLPNPDLTTGRTMDFVRASCKMILMPDGFEAGTAQQMMTTGMSLKFRQVP